MTSFLSHRRPLPASARQLYTAQGPVGPVGDVLAGHQVKNSQHGYRQVDVFPKMNAQRVGTVAPPVVGKDWDRPRQKTQFGWKWQDLRGPDVLHQPVLNELAQYSWKNKVATTFHAADLRPSNRFVPRRSAAPFVTPRDYVPRGGVVPRVTDLAGDEGAFTPLQPGVQVAPVTSLQQDATLPRLLGGGGGLPFTPTGRAEVPTAIRTLNRSSDFRGAGNGIPGPSTGATHEVIQEIAARTEARQEIAAAFDNVLQRSQAIQQAIGSLQEQLNLTVPPSTEAEAQVQASLQAIQETLGRVLQTIQNPASLQRPPPYVSKVADERFDAVLNGLERLDRTATALSDRVERLRAPMPPTAVDTLLRLAEQLTRFENQTTQLLSMSSERVGDLVAVNTRLIDEQTRMLQIQSDRFNALEANIHAGRIRTEEIGQTLETMIRMTGQGLQALAQLIQQGFHNQAGAQMSLRHGQQEMVDHIQSLESVLASLPVEQRPAFQQFVAVLQQWNVIAYAAEQTLPPIESPVNVAQREQLESVTLPENAPPSVIEYIAPSPPPSVLVHDTGALVVAPRFGGPLGRPPWQNRFDAQPPLSTGAAPLDVPLNADVEQAGGPVVANGVAAEATEGVEGMLMPPDGEDGTCPPGAASAGAGPEGGGGRVRYTQYPYPIQPAGVRRLIGFDRSRHLIDQDPGFFRTYGSLTSWNLRVKHVIGSQNRRLFFAIRRAYNMPSAEERDRALGTIRTSTTVLAG